MKDTIKKLSDVGFIDSKNYNSKISDKEIPVDVIIARFNEKKEVPTDIIQAISYIKENIKKKRAAVHLLRITIYAKTISNSKGGIRAWFEFDRVTDMRDGSKIPVNIIKKAATKYCKTIENLKKNSVKVEDLEKNSSKLTKQQRLSMDKTASKVDAYTILADEEASDFLQALDLIYMSLASERK